MKPDLDRSDQVVAHVVAWHNRHPLAERIGAALVHSVGVVSLPFAVQGARFGVAAAEVASASPAAPAGPDEAAPAVPTAPATHHTTLPARPRPWHPRSWWQRWQGRQPFQARFSEDFIAPLRPQRVAGFAAVHGVAVRPLEAEAPQRLIAADVPRRDDSATDVELHLITAAIGIGERRERLLLAPDGRVLGRRHWSRARVAAATGPMLLLLALLGLDRGPPPTGQVALARGASAASAAAVASAAPAAPSAPVAARPASALPRSAAAAPSAPASAPATALDRLTVATAAVPPVASAAASSPRAMPGVGLGRPPLVARLPDAERRALREAARQLRAAAPAPAKAWALATGAADRRLSLRAAVLFQALARLQPQPMQAELLQAPAGWRAVFWPFRSEQDAQRARLALADKGLQTEVIEF